MEVQEILQDIVFILLYGGVMGLNVVAALYLLWRVETLQTLSESTTAEVVEEPAEDVQKASARTIIT